MNPDEIDRLRLLIIKVFEDHPSLQSFSLSNIKEYVDDRELYSLNTFAVARYGDIILNREEFIVKYPEYTIDESGTE